MIIQHYQFGSITINGKSYTSDVIIYRDKVDSTWWRKQGHSLVPEDISEVIRRKPKVLIVGCGASGCLKIPEKTLTYLDKQSIQVIALPTSEACQEYNKLVQENSSVIAALHLTC